MRSVVFAPALVNGGVKSLYAVCSWLRRFGESQIQPFGAPGLARWFAHDCTLFDHSYEPDLVVYPEVYQPEFDASVYHLCFALGRHNEIRPHADLVICRSPEILHWVREHAPQLRAEVIVPSIDRRPFEYDDRRKVEQICYFTRLDKHPETALALRARYGAHRVIEIVDCSEREVAERLRQAQVMVWRGHRREGSPRPPKEALVAGCHVVGLEDDMRPGLATDFGVKCQSIEELLEAPECLFGRPPPTIAERAVVRSAREEERDWATLVQSLALEKVPA